MPLTRLTLYLICLTISLAFPLKAAIAYRLIGRIEHSDSMEPVSQEEESGKLFESTDLYKKMMASKSGMPARFAIPSWLAGVWQRTQAVETSRIQLPSGMRLPPAGVTVAKVTDHFGSYRDSKGKIWQVFDPAHAMGSVDRGASIDVSAVGSYDLAILSPNSVAIMVQACHAVVDKKTKKVVSAYQDEELNTYTNIEGSVLRTDGSVKMFDTKGKPLVLTRSASSENKIGPFVPTMPEPQHLQKRVFGLPRH